MDDDIRVEFGKAHEHARIIASEVIVGLTKLLPGKKLLHPHSYDASNAFLLEFDDTNVLSDLLLTIASLAVRHEFCLAIEDAGGLQYLFDILVIVMICKRI